MSAEAEKGWPTIEALLEEENDLREALRPLLADGDPGTIEALLEEVDQSDYSLVDWGEALVEFDRWLAGRETPERPLPEMIGYIHCCTLTNAPGIPLGSLKVIVSQSLTNHGFAAISGSQF